MADSSSTFWALFLQEAYEQLEQIEAMLLAGKFDIHALFRCFHTLKGGFTAVDLSSLSTVAHQCEDILSVYRVNGEALSTDCQEVLHEVLSYLRRGLLHAEQTGTSPDLDQQLIDKIKHLAEQSTSDGSNPYKQLSLLAKTAVPAIALSLQTHANKQQLQLSLQAFVTELGQHKFINLHKAVRTLIEQLADESSKTTTLSIVANCFEQLHFIEDIYQTDLSLSLAAQLSRRYIWSDFINKLQSVEKCSASQAKESDLQVIEQHLSAIAWFSIVKQWRYLRHIRKKLQHNPSKHLADRSLQGILAIMLAKDVTEESAFQAIEILLEQLRCSLSTVENQGHSAESAQQLDQALLSQQPAISQQALADLSSKQRQVLAKALKEQQYVFELHLSFEQQKLAEQVFTNLEKHVVIVHSYTLFQHHLGEGMQTAFAFLCVSQYSFLEICQQMQAIDSSLQTIVNAPLTRHSVDKQTIKPVNTADAIDELSQDTARSLANIRVEGHMLEALIDQISSAKVQLTHLTHQLDEALSNPHSSAALSRVNERQQALMTQLDKAHALSLQLRVISISFALRRFHSFVSSTAQKLGKKAKLIIEGGETKIDKSLMDALIEPIAHLIRNAIDHGIESPEERMALGKSLEGSICIKASEKNGEIVLNIVDDGRGLNSQSILSRAIELGILQDQQEYAPETILQQIFFPGFTMAKTVTEISGRGVGMDVVKNSIVSAGGRVAVSSVLGQSVDIELCLPVSAHIQKVLLLEQSGQHYALPERWLLKLCDYNNVLKLTDNKPYIMHQQQAVPLYYLDQLFQLKRSTQPTYSEIAILQHENYTIAVAIERVLNRSEILMKKQEDYWQHIVGISAASILSNGQIVLIIDGLGLFNLALGNQIHGLKA